MSRNDVHFRLWGGFCASYIFTMFYIHTTRIRAPCTHRDSRLVNSVHTTHQYIETLAKNHNIVSCMMFATFTFL